MRREMSTLANPKRLLQNTPAKNIGFQSSADADSPRAGGAVPDGV